MKTLLLLGDDKITRRFVREYLTFEVRKKIIMGIDRTWGVRRVFRLLTRRRVSLGAMVAMLFAELVRKSEPPFSHDYAITTSEALKNLIDKERIKRVMLFRVGLVIPKSLLKSNASFFNVHCASVPAYTGLASLYRALADKEFHQEAVFHKVAAEVDRGVVIDREPYVLDPQRSYVQNEAVAYEAGYQLLKRHLI